MNRRQRFLKGCGAQYISVTRWSVCVSLDSHAPSGRLRQRFKRLAAVPASVISHRRSYRPISMLRPKSPPPWSLTALAAAGGAKSPKTLITISRLKNGNSAFFISPAGLKAGPVKAQLKLSTAGGQPPGKNGRQTSFCAVAIAGKPDREPFPAAVKAVRPALSDSILVIKSGFQDLKCWPFYIDTIIFL